MRILWFNWRDIYNPDAGGAEVLTHEVAKRLVKNERHKITLFTSSFRGAVPFESIDGVDVIRDGGKFTVYQRARSYYKNNNKNFDLVIDEINVKPFLTPKFVKDKPILAIIHQISSEQFLHELPFPLSFIGYYYLEKRWLSYYKNIPTVTVSNSTRMDLMKLGFSDIKLMPEGLSVEPLSAPPQKEIKPTVAFIGRLKKHKLPDHALLAFSYIKRIIPESQLWIIGDGYMRKELERMSRENDVTFF